MGQGKTSTEGSFKLRYKSWAVKDKEDNYSRQSLMGLGDGKSLAYSTE